MKSNTGQDDDRVPDARFTVASFGVTISPLTHKLFMSEPSNRQSLSQIYKDLQRFG